MSYIIQNPLLFNKNKTLIADIAYNIKKLKNKVDELKLYKLLTQKNICNGKHK